MIIAIARTVILYIVIIIGIRLLGKHQVSELEPSEFVLALIIADIAAVPMQDFGIPLLMGLVPIACLLCLSMIISVLNMKSLKLRKLLSGSPSILIREGKLDQKEMRKTRMTLDEVLEELRLQGYTSLAAVKYAILETNGQLSVLPYAQSAPPTARDLGVMADGPSLPLVLINDGRVLTQNLRARGLNEVWLQKQLEKNGAGSPKSVFLLTVDENNQVYFIGKELG